CAGLLQRAPSHAARGGQEGRDHNGAGGSARSNGVAGTTQAGRKTHFAPRIVGLGSHDTARSASVQEPWCGQGGCQPPRGPIATLSRRWRDAAAKAVPFLPATLTPL